MSSQRFPFASFAAPMGRMMPPASAQAMVVARMITTITTAAT
ncbi:hypothetical protein FHY06_000815 [Variovorax sp. BK613]|jgi:hypothetical protein|nr:hypothetical protein [Variovorax sp. BK613]